MLFLRYFIILISLFFSIYSNCQISYSLSNKFWRLKYAKIDGKEYSFNSSNDNAPTLQFNGANIRGNGGCNAYHTRFTINGSDAEIGTVNSTRMNCTDMYLDESSYFRALGQSQTLSISGDNEFTMFNAVGDKLVFFAQFARSVESAIPPARREYSSQQRSEEYIPRRSRSRASNSQAKLSRRELSRQKALEKKMNSKRKGKLTKAERRELMALQSKQKKAEGTKKGKKGRVNADDEGNVKKKGKKSKKDQSEEKVDKKTKKGKKGRKEKTEDPKSKKSSKNKKGKEEKNPKKKKTTEQSKKEKKKKK
ncbi:MAG: META domain-containing protein [Chitinophagales bacterium]